VVEVVVGVLPKVHQISGHPGFIARHREVVLPDLDVDVAGNVQQVPKRLEPVASKNVALRKRLARALVGFSLVFDLRSMSLCVCLGGCRWIVWVNRCGLIGSFVSFVSVSVLVS